VAILSFGTVLIAHTLLYPELFKSFIGAIQMRTLTRDDVGMGAYGRLSLRFSQTLALIIHFLVVVVIGCLGLAYFIKNQLRHAPAYILFLYFILTACNLRLKEYDIPLMLFSLFSNCVLII